MAFVYLPDRQEALLFGGQGGPTGYLNDTWLWKAGCWTQLSPANNPPTMSAPAIAYDAARAKAVLWGEHYGPTGWVAETWTWNGQDWTKSTAIGPEGVAVAAYDPNIGRVVLFDSYTNETWTWDGSQWQKMSPAHEPGGRYETSMTFDPATKTPLLFGGFVGGSGLAQQFLSDTWSWNGTDWSRLNPSASPPARADVTLVSYSAGNRVLLLGGQNGAVLADAWIWDGRTWAAIASFGMAGSAGAIDTGSCVIVFGGWTDTKYTSNTRSWDGTSWATQ